MTAAVAELGTDSGRRLFAALAGCDLPWRIEPSAKAIGGVLRTGRFLVSLPRGALGPGPSRRLRAICVALTAPEAGLALLDRHQSSASVLHFGIEPEAQGDVLKCYLEFPEPATDLVFLALKWGAGRWRMSEYHNRDHLPPAAQAALARDILPETPARAAFLDLMARAPGMGGARLLEVTEPGTPRRSLDLNLADCGLTLSDADRWLAALLNGAAGARAYLDAHSGDGLGHVAIGRARDGQGFATLYHGMRRVDTRPGGRP